MTPCISRGSPGLHRAWGWVSPEGAGTGMGTPRWGMEVFLLPLPKDLLLLPRIVLKALFLPCKSAFPHFNLPRIYPNTIFQCCSQEQALVKAKQELISPAAGVPCRAASQPGTPDSCPPWREQSPLPWGYSHLTLLNWDLPSLQPGILLVSQDLLPSRLRLSAFDRLFMGCQ